MKITRITAILFENITRRPVKQSPHLHQVEYEMRRIGMGTFLGSDKRRLTEILDDDHELVNSLNLTHEEIASRLEEITRAAKKKLGDRVTLENRYEVRAQEHRGMIPCPWGHLEGLFAKSYVELRDLSTGNILIWSDLSIHLIRGHGFYQGKGSPFRLEPKVLKQVFWSAP
jgi:hypothetical protein